MPIKFSALSDIKLFKALQRHGRDSYEKLSKETSLPKTTIQYAFNRLMERKFFDIIAIPRIEDFPELPYALLAFTDIQPKVLKALRKKYIKRVEVRAFATIDDTVVFALMHESKEKLYELIFEITENAKVKPVLNMRFPIIEKLDIAIPDGVLDKLYSKKKAENHRGKIK